VGEVKEIWKFVNYISPEIPETNKIKENLAEELTSLKKQVKAIQMKLNL
jgi:restriction endonuclease S subunit